MKLMKVWIGLSITIDADALEDEYGEQYTTAEARADVKASVVGVLSQVLYPESSHIVVDVKETR